MKRLLTTLLVVITTTLWVNIAHTGEALKRQLFPACNGIIEDESTWTWKLGDNHYVITSIDRDLNIHIIYAEQELIVARALIAQDDSEAAAAIPMLLEKARQAGIATADLLLDRGLLTGIHLRNNDVYVLPQGVLRKEQLPQPDFDAQRTLLTATTKQLIATLPQAGLSSVGRSTMQRFLSLLASPLTTDEDTDPDYLRQLVVHGWLNQQLPHSDQREALQAAMNAAMALQVTQQWIGDKWILSKYENAFQQSVWTLRGPERSARLQAHHTLQHAPAVPCQLLSEFPADTDPLQNNLTMLSAQVFWGRKELAQWDPQHGLQANLANWRLARPDEGYGISKTVPVNFIPPHIVLSGADGSVLGLVTKGGLLIPPTTSSTAEHQRFLTDAATQLTDAVHLDLIGQVLFSYVHDSPDSAMPQLIGFRAISGDIHQTITQTLNTCLFGMMRGDCDDLSEIYQTILTQQNRLSYVMSLPRHAACVWSEHHGDMWTTYILQTGQPVACSDTSLAKSLVAVYNRFDRQGAFDGSLISLLLRFAGENTRSAFSLSNRILTEANYAHTLIEVQRDLYYHTYAHGITTMQSMLQNGDQDPANWLELAGLFQHTGEMGKATAMMNKVIEQDTDPLQRLQNQIRMLSYMAEQQQHDQCEGLVNTLIEHELPAIAEHNKTTAWWMAHRLRAVLDEDHHGELRQRIFSTWLFPPLHDETQRVRAWAQSNRFALATWNNQLRDYRTRMGVIVAEIMKQLTNASSADVYEQPQLQQYYGFIERYINDFSFLQSDDRALVSGGYGLIGMLAAHVLGSEQLDVLLANTPFPTEWREDHRQRLGGVAQLYRDLPWIRCSVAYWSQRLSAELAKEVLESERIIAVIKHLTAAYNISQELEIISPGHESTLLYADTIAALLTEDSNALDAVLTRYRDQQDKRSDAALCATIGAMAPHLAPTWFTTVLQHWHTIAATKPGYFTIAWSCVQNKAIAQALVAGAFAAAQHQDDAIFVDEFVYLQRVLAGGDLP